MKSAFSAMHEVTLKDSILPPSRKRKSFSSFRLFRLFRNLFCICVSTSEAYQSHSPAGFGIEHKPSPDIPASQVLGAEQNDADVNPDHIGIDPAVVGIESVRESVASVNFVAEFLAHLAQRRQRDFRCEHQRPTRRAGYN